MTTILMTKAQMQEKYPNFDKDLYKDVKEGIPSYRGSEGYFVFNNKRMEKQLLHEVGHACELFGSIDNAPQYHEILDKLDEGQTTGSNFQENFAELIKDYVIGKKIDPQLKKLIKKWGIVG